MSSRADEAWNVWIVSAVLLLGLQSSLCFKFTSSPADPLVVVLGKNTTDVTLSWKLTFDSGDSFSNLKIFRFKKDAFVQTQIRLMFHDSGGNTYYLNSSLYIANASASNGPSTGYAILTIKDIMRQPNNKDGSLYKPLSEVYVYRLAMTLPNLTEDQDSEVEVRIYYAAFTWLHSDVSVSFAEGQTATLFWSVDVGSGKSWGKVEISRNSIKSEKDKEDIVSFLKTNGKKTVLEKAREADIDLVIQGTSNIVNVTFTLRNLTRSTDDKYYRVNVFLESGFTSDSTYTKLLVLVLPGPSLIQVQPIDQVSCQGKHVSLACNATVGNPADTSFTFYRNNEVVTSLSGVQNGNEVKASYNVALIAGINSFTCAANNSAGSTDRSTAVNITAKESPVITNCNDRVAAEGTNLIWTCQVTGSRHVTTSWMKGNQVISSGNTLNITTITRSDAGMYRFTASNRDGCLNATKAVNLTVHFLPGSPTFQVVDQVSCQGKHVNLTCTATVGNPADTSFAFYRNNEVVTSLSGVQNGNEVKATHTVALIGGINSFTCAANNLAGTADSSTAVNITAKEPPVITDCSNTKATEKTSLKWTCHATGSQPIRSSWFKKDNDTAISFRNFLNISSIKRTDAGLYRFTVSNGDECPNASTTVYLTVQYQAEIAYPESQSCNPMTVNENQSSALVCKAEGEPTPTITWTKDGIPLFQKGSPLVLRNVMRNQAGNYTCIADNGIGTDTACWRLDVKDFQNIKQCGKTYRISTAQCLTVYPIGYPFPSVRCLPNGNVLVTRDGSTYKICGKKESTNTTCTVYNTADSCDIQIEVYKQILDKVWFGRYRITNFDWNDSLENRNSKEFKTMKDKNEDMLKSVYAQQLFVTLMIVLNFRKGSVIVDYQLIISADVPDPSLPFKQALNSSGGNLNGLTIDPSSLQQVILTESCSTPTSSEIPEPCQDQVLTKVLGVCFGLSVILNVVFIVYIVWKYRQKQNEERTTKRENINKESAYENAIALQIRHQSSNKECESVDDKNHPAKTTGNPSTPVYQSIQPAHSGAVYSSLSSATRLPSKPTLPSSQSQANTQDSVYQNLHGAPHQYQSLDSFHPSFSNG